MSAYAQFLFFTTTTAADGTFFMAGFPSYTPVQIGAARAGTCLYYNTPGVDLSGGPGDAVDVGTLVLRADIPIQPGR